MIGRGTWLSGLRPARILDVPTVSDCAQHCANGFTRSKIFGELAGQPSAPRDPMTDLITSQNCSRSSPLNRSSVSWASASAAGDGFRGVPAAARPAMAKPALRCISLCRRHPDLAADRIFTFEGHGIASGHSPSSAAMPGCRRAPMASTTSSSSASAAWRRRTPPLVFLLCPAVAATAFSYKPAIACSPSMPRPRVRPRKPLLVHPDTDGPGSSALARRALPRAICSPSAPR